MPTTQLLFHSSTFWHLKFRRQNLETTLWNKKYVGVNWICLIQLDITFFNSAPTRRCPNKSFHVFKYDVKFTLNIGFLLSADNFNVHFQYHHRRPYRVRSVGEIFCVWGELSAKETDAMHLGWITTIQCNAANGIHGSGKIFGNFEMMHTVSIDKFQRTTICSRVRCRRIKFNDYRPTHNCGTDCNAVLPLRHEMYHRMRNCFSSRKDELKTYFGSKNWQIFLAHPLRSKNNVTYDDIFHAQGEARLQAVGLGGSVDFCSFFFCRNKKVFSCGFWRRAEGNKFFSVLSQKVPHFRLEFFLQIPQ